MAEILCYIYIFHLTSLTLSHCLIKYKSTKFYSFSGKLLNNSVRILFYLNQFNNFWQIHDKIAETLCLVLEVCPAPRTQALDDAPLAAIAASRIDWSRRPNSSIRRISNSLTLAILDWKTLPCIRPTLQILWSSGFRPGEFGDHRVRETKSGTFRSRRATVSMRQCTVRLKDNTRPWDFRYRPMSGSSFLARRLSR